MGDQTINRDRAASAHAITNPEQRSRVAALARCIAGRLALCSEDELKVVDDLLARLEKGRDAYGPLDLSRDDRDWHREELEEQLDAALYRSFARIRRRDEQLERLRCEAADEIAATDPIAFGLLEITNATRDNE
jgi:hypothetical protein